MMAQSSNSYTLRVNDYDRFHNGCRLSLATCASMPQKAIHILVPFIKKVNDGGQEKMKLYRFGCKPVFRAEDMTIWTIIYRIIAYNSNLSKTI